MPISSLEVTPIKDANLQACTVIHFNNNKACSSLAANANMNAITPRVLQTSGANTGGSCHVVNLLVVFNIVFALRLVIRSLLCERFV